MEMEKKESNLLEELFRMRDEWRARRAKAMIVVKGKGLEWEANRQGNMKWYLHPSQQDRTIRSLVVFLQQIPAGSRTGKQRHPGGIAHYILEGRGYAILNGARHDWEAGDCVVLPILPNGVEVQHFNSDPERAAVFIAAEPNLFDALGVDGGSGFEQLESAPDARSEGPSERGDGSGSRKEIPKDQVARKVETAHPHGETQEDTYEQAVRFFADARRRSLEGKVVIKGKECPWQKTRQGYLQFLLTPWSQDASMRNFFVFLHDIRRHSGKHVHQGGLAIFVLEGEGYTVVNGRRFDWEKGDLILLPIEPGGIEHQHFNKREGKPCRWLALIYAPFLDALGSELEQRENAPSE